MKRKPNKALVTAATFRLKAFLQDACAVPEPGHSEGMTQYRVPTILGELVVIPYLGDCWIACRWSAWWDKNEAGKDSVRKHFDSKSSVHRYGRLNQFSGKWNFQEYVELDHMLEDFERELGKLRYRMGFANYDILERHGYVVEVYAGSDLVERYDAGDSHADSQCFGTGDIDAGRLKEMAISTAKELMDEKRVRGPIDPNEDLLAEEREQQAKQDEIDCETVL